MSVRLTSQENRVALFDSVTGLAFGPTFEDERNAEHFLTFLIRDPRTLTSDELGEAYEAWLREITASPCAICGSYGHFTFRHRDEGITSDEALA